MTKNLLRNKLIKNYETSPLIRGLIQLVPLGIGAGVDTALVTHLQNIRYKRYKIFFDEFLDEKLNIQDSLLNSEDFLHCYFKTLSAALNTRRDEKIKMFARMLKSASLCSTYKDIDEYEELLNILDELSYRELFILFKMDKYVINFKTVNNSINILSNSELKKKFYTELETDLNINKDEIISILVRLTRSGCFELVRGVYVGADRDDGVLTPLWFRLKKFIVDSEKNH